jgi:flagellar motor switch/type III secretory pathway protein FliN
MSVLQRKAQVGRQEHQARAMTVAKALRVGLAKVGEEPFGMALAAIGVTQEKTTIERLLEDAGEGKLALMLDGPGGKTAGALIGRNLVSAMVQQQTTGRVSASEVSDRKMTSTDAALCAPLVDLLFARANALLETPQERDVLPLFKFGARADSLRLFAMGLEEPEYNVMRLTVDIAAGAAQAPLILILPIPAAKPEPVVAPDGGVKPAVVPTLENTVMGLEAELAAVLCRMRLPLVEVSAFEVGQKLAIPPQAFDAVQIVSIEGRLIGSGAMGQVDGQRALMVNAANGEKRAGASQNGPAAYEDTEASDYSNLDLPALDMSGGNVPFDPSNLDDLPDLPDLETAALDALPDLPDLPDIDDGAALPDLPDLPDIDLDLPDIDDLPKINIA